jgi:hypothetical protein
MASGKLCMAVNSLGQRYRPIGKSIVFMDSDTNQAGHHFTTNGDGVRTITPYS